MSPERKNTGGKGTGKPGRVTDGAEPEVGNRNQPRMLTEKPATGCRRINAEQGEHDTALTEKPAQYY